MKVCTKNYKNPSIFVKVTAKKSVAPCLYGGAENAGVENAGGITYGKPSEQKTLKISGV